MIYAKSDNVCFSFSQNVATIRDKDADLYYTTNDVSSTVWELIDGYHSVDEIIKAVVEEFEVEEKDAREDILDLFSEMEDLGLVKKIS